MNRILSNNNDNNSDNTNLQLRNRKKKHTQQNLQNNQPNIYSYYKNYSIFRAKANKYNKRGISHNDNLDSQNNRVNLLKYSRNTEKIDIHSKTFHSDSNNRQKSAKLYINKKITSSNSNSKSDYMQFKLSDLINPMRNQTFIKNLYAQFEPNSNKINLLYLTSMEQSMPENSMLLTAELLVKSQKNISKNNNNTFDITNKLINDFYLSALKINGSCKLKYLNNLKLITISIGEFSRHFQINFKNVSLINYICQNFP